MIRIMIAIIGCCVVFGCTQHVNPSWAEGNLTKKEHMRRRLERLENTQQDVPEALADMADPSW